MSGLAESYLRYRGYRYLKVALLLVTAAIATYVALVPPEGRSGSTWVGYGLGTVAALLMLWLMWLGVRKRRYASHGAPLQGWVSAHVYLGATLLVLVPLHCAFQFGWNLHTLAFVLTALVVLSGALGVVAYALVPSRITDNRPGRKLSGLLQEAAEIDYECGRVAAAMPDAVERAVERSVTTARIGGGVVWQLTGRTRTNPASSAAIAAVEGTMRGSSGPVRDQATKLLELLELKRVLLARIERDVHLKALLDGWLVVHVPLAFAAVVAVAVHVFVVFYYR